MYNEIFLAQIIDNDPNNEPDGKVFRKNSVYIHDGFNNIHTGLFPEEEIIRQVKLSLKMVEDPEIPGMIKIACFHFMFGYIHPFYDGNGRLNRYLSALFLLHDLRCPCCHASFNSYT
ncbi:Fic family protein [Ileibacterium valens]|uniref:Fic family protein n=1 Tax=Ileibacterium valens TaxID=1862668 RepID=UPI00330712DF